MKDYSGGVKLSIYKNHTTDSAPQHIAVSACGRRAVNRADDIFLLSDEADRQTFLYNTRTTCHDDWANCRDVKSALAGDLAGR